MGHHKTKAPRAARCFCFIQAAGLAYHHAQACISSPQAYIITAGVSSSCGLMIYNSFGIDDIQGLRLDDIPQQVADDIHGFAVIGSR